MNSFVRVCTIVAGAATLAACGSIGGLDLSTGPSRSGVVSALQLESDPPGAEAKTSVGPGCRTPCAVNVPADREFTVSFTLNGYLPATESVKPVLPDDGRVDIEAPTQPTVELQPNPVFAALQPAPPSARSKAKAKPRAQTKQPARAQAPEPAPAPPAAGNWPTPAQGPPPAWPAPQSTPR